MRDVKGCSVSRTSRVSEAANGLPDRFKTVLRLIRLERVTASSASGLHPLSRRWQPAAKAH
jgi:hypothetical protein